MERKDLISCSVCDKNFVQKQTLYKHLRNVHHLEPLLVKKAPQFDCEICDKKYALKSSLSNHIKKFHQVLSDHSYSSEVLGRKSRLICPHPTCEEKFPTYHQFRTHLIDQHELEIELEELTFDSLADFHNWKMNMEQQTLALYTLDTGGKKLVNGIDKQYYNCHRSYNYKSKGKNKRAIKSMGSNKINKACPSRLEVKIHKNDGILKISTKFWKSHYGHGAQIERIMLAKRRKAKISGKLKEKVTVEHILDTG